MKHVVSWYLVRIFDIDVKSEQYGKHQCRGTVLLTDQSM